MRVVSVVIPTLNEQACIEACLAAVARAAKGRSVEVLVVDGGSVDATREAAARAGAQVLCSAAGRAVQLNAGAAASRGDVLLFLHADCLLPGTAFAAMDAALSVATVVCGSFPIRFDAPGLSYALVGRLANLRTRIDKTAYGDQGIFVRRRAFEQVGGYPEVVLCEDVLLMRRLRSVGAYVFLSSPTMVTSARRLQRRGVMRNALVNLVIRTGLSLGVSPQRLKCLYPEHGVAEAGEGR